MSFAVRAALASGVVAASAAAGFAQTTGGNTGGTTGGSAGGTASGLQGGSATPQTGQALQLDSVTGSIASGEASGANVQQSNAFRTFYANPLYQGRAGAAIGTAPGGFGTALYNSTGGTTGVGGNNRAAGGNTATGGNRVTGGNTTTGTGGTSAFGTSALGTAAFGGTTTARTGAGVTGFGAAGGRTGTTGFGTTGRSGITGLGTTGRGGVSNQNSGEVIPYQRAIIATAAVRLPAPAVAPPQMQADLRATLDRSSMLTNPRGIEVLTDGRAVILRGTVRDEEEARTAEGMVRLTPGVAAVRNELKYPTP